MLYRKISGAYAGSIWKSIVAFPHNGKTKMVCESVSVPGLLHIFDAEQMELCGE